MHFLKKTFHVKFHFLSNCDKTCFIHNCYILTRVLISWVWWMLICMDANLDGSHASQNFKHTDIHFIKIPRQIDAEI